MTLLNAFCDIPDMGAKKFPAAPDHKAPRFSHHRRTAKSHVTADYKVNSSECFNCLGYGILEAFRAPHISLSRHASLASGERELFGNLFKPFPSSLCALNKSECGDWSCDAAYFRPTITASAPWRI